MSVSIIIPCLNEEKTIGLLLDSLLSQTFPMEQTEIIIADGLSQDNTRSVITHFMAEHPGISIKIIDNPKKGIPSALNLAINNSSGDIIIRLDAHCIPDRNYIERCVADLNANLGDNVGGLWKIKPGDHTWIAQSIAQAASNPVGVGDARYRYSTKPGLVDTVPFGAYFRSTLQRLGGYDETLLTNEDYELNARLIEGGGRVYFDPDIRSAYYSRGSLTDLARQYWRYGYWKFQMLKRYPKTIRWRQGLPPLFIIMLVLLLIGSLFFPVIRILLASLLGVYLAILVAGSIPAIIHNHKWYYLLGIPLAIAIMHFSWGAGILVSIFRGRR